MRLLKLSSFNTQNMNFLYVESPHTWNITYLSSYTLLCIVHNLWIQRYMFFHIQFITSDRKSKLPGSSTTYARWVMSNKIKTRISQLTSRCNIQMSFLHPLFLKINWMPLFLFIGNLTDKWSTCVLCHFKYNTQQECSHTCMLSCLYLASH